MQDNACGGFGWIGQVIGVGLDGEGVQYDGIIWMTNMHMMYAVECRSICLVQCSVVDAILDARIVYLLQQLGRVAFVHYQLGEEFFWWEPNSAAIVVNFAL